MNSKRSLLIVEDDVSFARALRRSFERRDFQVYLCDATEGVHKLLAEVTPDYAVVDLKLPSGSGLECVKLLHEHDPLMKIVVLTGFASISTAVEAIKLGACQYLPKPSNTNDIIAAFEKVNGDATVPLTTRQTSLKNLEWERIHETLVDAEFNISETARRLGMHRRTLARKLEKWRVK
ncbi:response regulator transcription factor [Brucellaceae bacterium C25G]